MVINAFLGLRKVLCLFIFFFELRTFSLVFSIAKRACFPSTIVAVKRWSYMKTWFYGRWLNSCWVSEIDINSLLFLLFIYFLIDINLFLLWPFSKLCGGWHKMSSSLTYYYQLSTCNHSFNTRIIFSHASHPSLLWYFFTSSSHMHHSFNDVILSPFYMLVPHLIFSVYLSGCQFFSQTQNSPINLNITQHKLIYRQNDKHWCLLRLMINKWLVPIC